MIRKIKIMSVGRYLPNRIVTADELDERLNLPMGWAFKKSGVRKRHYIENETASFMGARAAEEAMHAAGLTLKDIDCIISGSGTYEQIIPCNAALIQKELGGEMLGIPAYDINSTCLSFVTALDTISYLVEVGRYDRVLIVSTDIASVGLNYGHKESCVLFGDGAAAVVIERTPSNESSHIITSRMETYSAGAHLTEIRGGGSKMHAREFNESTKDEFLFHMDGRKVFRLSSSILPAFMQKLLKDTNISLDAIKAVIPHQASGMSLRILREKLGISEEQFINVIENYGNTISSSIPIALYEAINTNKLQRGDNAILIGTSAGLSIGGVIFEY